MHVCSSQFWCLQLEAQQDSIVSCDMSPSGEELVFGSAGGYLHLWALNAEPRVSQLLQPLEQVPRLASLPAITLTESDSFALAAVYPPEQVPHLGPCTQRFVMNKTCALADRSSNYASDA